MPSNPATLSCTLQWNASPDESESVWPVWADRVQPGARISGLIRPSHVGPLEENTAMLVPAEKTAALQSHAAHRRAHARDAAQEPNMDGRFGPSSLICMPCSCHEKAFASQHLLGERFRSTACIAKPSSPAAVKRQGAKAKDGSVERAWARVGVSPRASRKQWSALGVACRREWWHTFALRMLTRPIACCIRL